MVHPNIGILTLNEVRRNDMQRYISQQQKRHVAEQYVWYDLIYTMNM